MQLSDYDERSFKAVVDFLMSVDPWKSEPRDDVYFRSIFTVREGQAIKLCHVDGGLAGVVAWQRFTLFPYGGYIRVLAVSEEHRRQGIGATLMKVAEADVFRMLKNCFVVVHDTNQTARRFYRSCGYDEVGPLPEYVHAGQTVLLLRKSMGPVW